MKIEEIFKKNLKKEKLLGKLGKTENSGKLPKNHKKSLEKTQRKPYKNSKRKSSILWAKKEEKPIKFNHKKYKIKYSSKMQHPANNFRFK